MSVLRNFRPAKGRSAFVSVTLQSCSTLAYMVPGWIGLDALAWSAFSGSQNVLSTIVSCASRFLSRQAPGTSFKSNTCSFDASM